MQFDVYYKKVDICLTVCNTVLMLFTTMVSILKFCSNLV
jgi:hypothetical protein